jgi:peptidoglycan hydrolase-like protein with peptidoglycan-binding domain
MSVSEPDDPQEREAGAVASDVVAAASNLAAPAIRQPSDARTIRRVHLDSGGRKVFDCAAFAGDHKLEACLNDEERLPPPSRGATVTKVQNGLLDDGGNLGKDGADGVYGPATGQAVMAFKAKHHLGFEQFPDVGPGTMAKLDELCAPPKCTLTCSPEETLDPVNCVCQPVQPQQKGICGPDITDWFVSQVNTASSDTVVLAIKLMLDAADLFASVGGTSAAEIGEAGATAAVLAQEALLGSAAPARTAIASGQIGAGTTSASNVASKAGDPSVLAAITLVAAAAIKWKGIVETGARYDFKNNVLNHLHASNCPLGCDEGEVGIVTLCPGAKTENCYEADLPGNLFYAAIGRLVGWSELALQLGSQLAELKDTTLTKFHPKVEWDPPTDTAAITLGFHGIPVPLTKSTLCGTVPKFRALLNARKGCDDCTTVATPDIK